MSVQCKCGDPNEPVEDVGFIGRFLMIGLAGLLVFDVYETSMPALFKASGYLPAAAVFLIVSIGTLQRVFGRRFEKILSWSRKD